MTEQAKKVFRILVWELLVLVIKLLLLFLLLVPTVTLSFATLWDGGEVGLIGNFCIWLCYWSLAFVLLILLPFRKYVYLRCPKMTRRRIWLSTAMVFSVTFLILFVYPVRERHVFEVKKKTFVMEKCDTLWNKLFRGKYWMPKSFFSKVNVVIYGESGIFLGDYSVNGDYHCTEPYCFLAEDGTPFTMDGGEPFYFTGYPRPRLKYNYYRDTGVQEWLRRSVVKELNQAALSHYVEMISKDSELVFEMPDFQCATNHVALAALDEWAAHNLIEHSDRMVRYVEHIVSHHDIMTSLPRIWRMPGMDFDLLNNGLHAAIGLAEQSSCPDKEIMRLLGYIMGTPGREHGEFLIPDDEIKQYANHHNDMVSSCALMELAHRQNLRERAKQLAEQHRRKEK